MPRGEDIGAGEFGDDLGGGVFGEDIGAGMFGDDLGEEDSPVESDSFFGEYQQLNIPSV